jgi:hypothetical protein
MRPNSGSLIFHVNDEGTGVPFYAIIQGFTFDGSNITTTSGNVVAFATFMRFLGNEFINTQACNAFMSGGNLEFINNKIHGGRFYCGDGSGGDYGYPIYIGSDNALFEGNELYDFPTFGFHCYRSGTCPSNITLRNNLIRDFGWAANCPWSGDARCAGRTSDARGVGILACGTGHQIYNNIVANGTTGINLYIGSNKQAYGNTVYNMSMGGILSDTSTDNVIKNNIVYNPTKPEYGDIRSWQAPDTTTYISNLCARSDTGCSLVADPLFIDAANGNLNPQSGSSATGIGAFR